jgi:3-isopropylmalate/(R)-2-methylmalate dehydratase small subunit
VNLGGRSVALPVANIDTDQIVPAKHMITTDKVGLGRSLFATWREQPDFVLNRPAAQGASVLVAGDNFGCGSSREHAPWALAGWGFRAVISTSFADIFRNNALKNGLLPVAVDPAFHAEAMEVARGHGPIEIDLEAQTVRLPSGRAAGFGIDTFAKRCLLGGLDELGYLLSHAGAIGEHERRVRG